MGESNLKGLLQYHAAYYIRSFKGIPPISLFILAIAVDYAYTPNPILDSYSFTSLVIFFVMGWITVTVFHAEDAGQKHITLLHAKSRITYYVSLYFICMVIGFLLSVAAVMYPIIVGAFGVPVTWVHLVMGLLAHFSLAVLSISLSIVFTRIFVKNGANTWWGVLSILLVSVVIASLKSKILYLKGIIWLFPPVHLSLHIMGASDALESIPLALLLKFGWIFLYGLLWFWIILMFVANKHRHV